MFRERYHIYEKPAWKVLSNILLAVVVGVMLVACMASYLNISSWLQSSIECICFVVSILVCHYAFISLYYKGIKTYICNHKDISLSKYSSLKFEQASRLAYIMPFVTISICVIDVVLTVCFGSVREEFSLLMLVTQFLYFLFMVVYKGYFLDLIVAFGKDTFLSGLYIVRYDNISEIRESGRKNALQDMVVCFFVLGRDGSIVGHDKFTLTDYSTLCQRINMGLSK